MNNTKIHIPHVKLYTSLPKNVQNTIADVVECYQNNKPCSVSPCTHDGVTIDTLKIIAKNKEMTFNISKDMIQYGVPIVEWVSYLIGIDTVTYEIVDNGGVFENE